MPDEVVCFYARGDFSFYAFGGAVAIASQFIDRI